MAGCRVTLAPDGVCSTSLSDARYHTYHVVPKIDVWHAEAGGPGHKGKHTWPLTCSSKYFCLGAFLVFLGSVLMCAFGFTVLLPHEATRGWRQVTCTVINSTFSKTLCSCSHQHEQHLVGDCTTKYPCLQVFIIDL